MPYCANMCIVCHKPILFSQIVASERAILDVERHFCTCAKEEVLTDRGTLKFGIEFKPVASSVSSSPEDAVVRKRG